MVLKPYPCRCLAVHIYHVLFRMFEPHKCLGTTGTLLANVAWALSPAMLIGLERVPANASDHYKRSEHKGNRTPSSIY